MPVYRRALIEGGSYFFTVVTYNRRKILIDLRARELLREAWESVQLKFPFSIPAICLLPDHIHCIWTLPEGDANYSLRWKEIKRLFTNRYLEHVGPGAIRNESHQRSGEAAIWQRRFWEHVLRDEEDFNRHVDYIHFNPVKHGLVKEMEEWPWSSFHRYQKMGYYPKDRYERISDMVNKMTCGE